MTLKNCNPIAAALCFFEILAISMFISNPLILAISFSGAILFLVLLTDFKESAISIALCFVITCLITALNPLFSHNGVTVLYYMNDNPVTVEAYLCGAGIGLAVSNVYLWCKAFGRVLTADRTVYIFGRMTPKTALVLSVALRYIPTLKRRARRLGEAQRTLGLASCDGYYDRIRAALNTFSVLVGWSLEDAVETSNAMRARGYGSKHLTTYSDFVFKPRDFAVVAFCLLAAVAVVAVAARHGFDFSYYPAVTPLLTSADGLTGSLIFAALAFLPSFFEVKDILKWKILLSKI